MLEKTFGGDCWMVEVRTSRGIDDLSGEPVDGRAIGVMGAPGLCSLLTVVNDGLNAGVWGEGAANETWDAVDVE
jgi:hypothetical protein